MSDNRTRPATPEYREGWDSTFGRKPREPRSSGILPHRDPNMTSDVEVIGDSVDFDVGAKFWFCAVCFRLVTEDATECPHCGTGLRCSSTSLTVTSVDHETKTVTLSSVMNTKETTP